TLPLTPSGSSRPYTTPFRSNALQAGTNPTDSFTVTVTDAAGLTDTRTIAINVVGADDTPVATGTYTHTVTDTAALDAFGALTGSSAAHTSELQALSHLVCRL